MASGAGDIAMPVTEHSPLILGTSWPLQSATAWSAYSDSFLQAANNLFPQLHTQQDIRSIVAPMEGAFVDAAHALINGRQTALENRIEGYRYLAKKALWASSEIHSTQADLVEIVNKAEEDIQAARDAAEKAKQAAAAVPGAAEAIEGQLPRPTSPELFRTPQVWRRTRDAEGAGKVEALTADIGTWSVPFGNPTLPESGGVPGLPAPAAPAPAMPQPKGGGAHGQPVNGHPQNSVDADFRDQGNQRTHPQSQQQNQAQGAGFHKPDGTDQTGTSPKQAPSAPQMGSGGSGQGLIGQMMKPISSGGGSSPGSMSPGSMMSPGSAGAGNGLGNPGGMNPAGRRQGSSLNCCWCGHRCGNGRGRGAPGLASLGSGIAETSARMASGAVSGAANGLGAVGNVGNQVAQNVAAGAAQAPVQAAAAGGSAALTAPAAAGRGGGWCSDGDDAVSRCWCRHAGDPGQQHCAGGAGGADDTGGRPTCQQRSVAGEFAGRRAGSPTGHASAASGHPGDRRRRRQR